MVSNMNNVQQDKSPIKTGKSEKASVLPSFAVKKQQQQQTQSVVSESVWDREERRKVETRNNNMRQTIYKEVKKPGRNYDRLLELLKELQGPVDIRQQYILDVIKEATRFKRTHMAQIILQQMPNLVVSIDSTS